MLHSAAAVLDTGCRYDAPLAIALLPCKRPTPRALELIDCGSYFILCCQDLVIVKFPQQYTGRGSQTHTRVHPVLNFIWRRIKHENVINTTLKHAFIVALDCFTLDRFLLYCSARIFAAYLECSNRCNRVQRSSIMPTNFKRSSCRNRV